MSQNIEDRRKQWPGASSNFMVGNKVVDPQKVWEPKSDYEKGGQYGLIHVHTSRAGHSFEEDNTPGGERLRWTHADSSYTEMQHDGTLIHRSNGSSFEVVVKDKNVRVKGAMHVQIDGDANVKVVGNMAAEVGGNLDATIGAKTHLKSGGDMTIETPNLIIKGQTVSHNGINIGDTHVHKGVTAGPDDTGTPLPL